MTVKLISRNQILIFVLMVMCFVVFAYLTKVDKEMAFPKNLRMLMKEMQKIQGLHHNAKNALHGYKEPEGLQPCGEICSYGGHVIDSRNEFFPQLGKDVECANIMQRMSFRNHTIVYPPPEDPPKEMVDEFTMFGKMPITKKWYVKGEISEDKPSVFEKEQLQTFVAKVKKGENVNVYLNGACYQEILKKHDKFIQGKSGVVIGTLIPWLEGILLAYDADSVTTLEYRNTTYKNLPKLHAYTPYDFADKYAKEQGEIRFDFAASFSSLEHSGLGRYTDPLNPYGDLEAAAQVFCMVKPGGMFALGVPGSRNESDGSSNVIHWNAHRRYGILRLQHLTANWKVIDYAYCAHHHILILVKPIE